MKLYVITSVEEMKLFFVDVIIVYKCLLHPDDFFADMVNEQGGPTFERGLASYLDGVMTACFVYCDTHDLDIYEIAIEIQVREYKKLGLLPKDLGTDGED
ncbi:MAG: hypothetical protein EOO02_12520 [Chitinophagaceae bacterium]|nr:MAG: hypothetical protein EOO02_12520 [Chitinophagaceae bacterium]